MHYYKRNLGDYAKKAGRLSMLQHGSYTLLIDACYDREQFPTMEQALEWTWASTKEEIEAVEFVLRRFFVLEGSVYVQTRIKQEIDEYHGKAETNKRIAAEREAKRKEKSTNRERIVDEALPEKHEPPPNHKPITINQEPLVRRATRIPPDFDPKPEPEAEAGIDRQRELANFRDYWTSKARDNTKLDWQATWRQWARKADRTAQSRFAKPEPTATVPSKPGRDPELIKAESDFKNRAPMPQHIREIAERLKAGKQSA